MNELPKLSHTPDEWRALQHSVEKQNRQIMHLTAAILQRKTRASNGCLFIGKIATRLLDIDWESMSFAIHIKGPHPQVRDPVVLSGPEGSLLMVMENTPRQGMAPCLWVTLEPCLGGAYGRSELTDAELFEMMIAREALLATNKFWCE